VQVGETTAQKHGRVRRGGRGCTGRAAQAKTIASDIPNIRRMPPAEFLSPAQIELIHDYSMRVLEDTGIEFKLPEALDILETNGCDVDRTTGRVFMPRKAVEHWVVAHDVPL